VSDRPRRLRGFSYKGQYRYFVTICTYGRVPVFEEPTHASWVMTQIQQLFSPRHFAVIAFSVMPDHVHLLLEGLTTDADLKATMHSWKQRTGFAWSRSSGGRLWQEGYYDYVLRDYDSVPGVVRYIVDNPIRRGLSSPESPYPYVGSSRYARTELDAAAADWRPQPPQPR
jgi:putative transposase